MAKYLLDTCIWRDFYEDRVSRKGTLLGEHATKLFTRIIKERDTIIFSEALVWELKRDYEEDNIMDMLNLLFFNNVLVRIEIVKEEFLEAKQLSKERKLPFIDCLNAIQARNHKAILVSQDRHILSNLSDITQAKRPEEIT